MKNLPFIFIITLLSFGAGCGDQIKSDTTTNQKAQPAQSKISIPVFHADIGQKFGEMAVEGIDKNKKLTFSGTTLISGTYGLSDLFEKFCFYPDKASAEKIPNLRRNPKNPEELDRSWFCFSNNDLAKKLLNSEGGEATIEINGFTDFLGNTNEAPSSELVRVIQKESSNSFSTSTNTQ